MSPSFSWGSVSVSYVVLDLHGTAVSNNDSSDDRKLLFLSWINAQFFSEMKHTIDRPFPPTHSIWPEHMISSKRAQLWLAGKHMWNDPCKHFWGLWRFFGELSWLCQMWLLLSKHDGNGFFCQKSGIKVAFDSEEWLWNFAESLCHK